MSNLDFCEDEDLWTHEYTGMARRQRVKEYLSTLRKLPDDIVLDLATRELELNNPQRCVCGWAVRASLGKLQDRDPARVNMEDVDEAEWLNQSYGFGDVTWHEIFDGVVEALEAPVIEEALRIRVIEAAG
jgi:hypothetical protein